MLMLSCIENVSDWLVKKNSTYTAYLIDMALASMTFREHQRQNISVSWGIGSKNGTSAEWSNLIQWATIVRITKYSVQ